MPKLTIRFANDTDELLKKLAAEKNVTKAEVIRRALMTYKYLNDETRDGDKRVLVTSASTKETKGVILP